MNFPENQDPWPEYPDLRKAIAHSDALVTIADRAGRRGLNAVATRVLDRLSAFPPWLIYLCVTALRGARVEVVQGCPGSAKTDLVAMTFLFMDCFTDLNMICSNQQND